MKKQTCILKRSPKEIRMIEYIMWILHYEAAKRGRNISWFQFAKRNKIGTYRFLSNKQVQWDVLETVACLVADKYNKTQGEIVDIISDLVNNPKRMI